MFPAVRHSQLGGWEKTLTLWAGGETTLTLFQTSLSNSVSRRPASVEPRLACPSCDSVNPDPKLQTPTA